MLGCEHGNEPSGSIKGGLVEYLSASQEGLCSMELVNWVHLDQYRDQWQALVNTVMSLKVP
jgi:hypothetical protein